MPNTVQIKALCLDLSILFTCEWLQQPPLAMNHIPAVPKYFPGTHLAVEELGRLGFEGKSQDESRTAEHSQSLSNASTQVSKWWALLIS